MEIGLSTPTIYLDESYNLHYPPGTKLTDDASEDVLLMAHEHWSQFPPVHPFIQHVFGLLFFFLWIISAFGNGLVVFIFLKTPALRTPSNMLIVCLALADFLMINSVAPPLFINIFIDKYWAFGPFLCELYGFLGGVFGTAALLMIIMIGYDRYNVIVKGFNGVKITPCISLVMIFFSYTYASLVSLAPLMHWWGSFSLEGLLLTCSFDYLTDSMSNKTFTACYFCGCYFAPFCVVVFFYSQIVAAVVSHERALRAQAKKMNVDSLRSNQDTNAESVEVRIAKVAITNVCVWLLAWTPYALVALMGQFGVAHLITPIVGQLPSFFAKTASCLNPIIYAVSHPKYRESLAIELPCLFGDGKSASDNTRTEAVIAENC